MLKRLTGIAFFALLCGSAGAGPALTRQYYWDQRLAHELPVGSPLPKVLSYFGKAGLESSYDSKSRTVIAIERNVEVRFPVTFDVMIKCAISETDTLRSCASSIVGTGP
jgi:hypothetical protein